MHEDEALSNSFVMHEDEALSNSFVASVKKLNLD